MVLSLQKISYMGPCTAPATEHCTRNFIRMLLKSGVLLMKILLCKLLMDSLGKLIAPFSITGWGGVG